MFVKQELGIVSFKEEKLKRTSNKDSPKKKKKIQKKNKIIDVKLAVTAVN